MRRLEIRPGFVALLCFLFYISPGAIFWPFLILSALHELGHLAVLTMFGVKVRYIRFGVLGTVMETEPMSQMHEAICALAGPVVNLFCFWALRPCLPGTALISLLLGCYNLLPVYPLDGGRALRALLCLCLPLRAAIIAESTAAVLTLSAVGIGVIAMHRSFGLIALIIYGLFLLRIVLERNCCCDSA